MPTESARNAMGKVFLIQAESVRIRCHTRTAVKIQTNFVRQFLRKHGWQMLFWFFGLLLPLWIFGALVEELHEGEAFPFDAPMLRAMHAMANTGLDRVFLSISAIGYAWGVIPVDAILILALALRRRKREALFSGLAIIGSLLLTAAAKHSFARARPALWDSIIHETTYSFPSGHAMGSMTLAWVAVLLCWNSRSSRGRAWRWPIVVIAALFVVLVGLSRVYLGVHYPSDILAGWAVASVWVVGMYGLVFADKREAAGTSDMNTPPNS